VPGLQVPKGERGEEERGKRGMPTVGMGQREGDVRFSGDKNKR
jgi:hypothetical protein